MPRGKLKIADVKLLGVLAALAMISYGWVWHPVHEAFSKPPIPAPTEYRQEIKQQAASGKDTSQSNQTTPTEIRAKQQTGDSQNKSPSDWLMIAFNGLLVICTFLLWFSTEKIVSGRRAFVFAQQVTSPWEIDPATGNPVYAFKPVWFNSGETQTRNLRTSVNSEFRDTPLPDDFNFIRPSSKPMAAIIGPKSYITGGVDRIFTAEEIAQVTRGERFLYVWGWAAYKDIFQFRWRKPHISRYCVQVTAFGDPTRPLEAPVAFNIIYIIHSYGNCTDGECAANPNTNGNNPVKPAPAIPQPTPPTRPLPVGRIACE